MEWYDEKIDEINAEEELALEVSRGEEVAKEFARHLMRMGASKVGMTVHVDGFTFMIEGRVL